MGCKFLDSQGSGFTSDAIRSECLSKQPRFALTCSRCVDQGAVSFQHSFWQGSTALQAVQLGQELLSDLITMIAIPPQPSLYLGVNV